MKKKSPKEKQIPLVSLSSSSLLWFLIFPSQDKEHEVFSHCLQGPVWSRPSHNASLFLPPGSATIYVCGCTTNFRQLCIFKSILISDLTVREVHVQGRRARLLCSGSHKAESSCWLD